MPSSPISGRARRPSRSRTREAILKAALNEFAAAGYGGARIERLVAAAGCNVRMVYHNFGSKRKLYQVVLETAYEDLRAKEAGLHLEATDPIEGILALYDFNTNYFATHPQFAALLTGENLRHGAVVSKSKRIPAMASNLRHSLGALLERGKREGVLRPGLDPAQLYVTIAALSWFHVAYVHTLSSVLNQDLSQPDWRQRRLTHGREVLRSYLAAR